jgi:hypothetical protein
MVPSRLNMRTIILLYENSSLNKKYAETISRIENNMKIKNFFINKRRKGCIQAADPLAF